MGRLPSNANRRMIRGWGAGVTSVGKDRSGDGGRSAEVVGETTRCVATTGRGTGRGREYGGWMRGEVGGAVVRRRRTVRVAGSCSRALDLSVC